ITRMFTYDGNQLLQTIKDPEAGTTPTTYTYYGTGQIKTINHNGLFTETHTYDSRERPTSITYSNGDPAVAYTWQADNLPDTASRGNVTRSFSYNGGRLLDTESIKIGSTTYPISYSYTADGQVSTLTYPDTTFVSLYPDAFGRPTVVGNYATNI